MYMYTCVFLYGTCIPDRLSMGVYSCDDDIYIGREDGSATWNSKDDMLDTSDVWYVVCSVCIHTKVMCPVYLLFFTSSEWLFFLTHGTLYTLYTSSRLSC